jgi:hypothetical protein
MEIEQFAKLQVALEMIGDLGYKEVWINTTNPHSAFLSGHGHIIASPKREKDRWPALWSLPSGDVFGRASCGNGLREADERCFGNSPLPPCHYKMVDGEWVEQ